MHVTLIFTSYLPKSKRLTLSDLIGDYYNVVKKKGNSMRKDIKGLLCLIVSFLVIAGCGAPVTRRINVNNALVEIEARTQRENALESEFDHLRRLYRVGYPLLTTGKKFSKKDKTLGMSLGAIIINKYDVDKDLRGVASRLYNLGEVLQVLYVIPEYSSDKAGLQTNDMLISINKLDIPSGKNAKKKFHKLMREQLKNEKSVSVGVMRDGEKHNIHVNLDKVCDHQIVLANSNEINAYTDGKKIIVTKGMLRFVNDDKELALVMAHELAHIVMGHVNTKKKNSALGSAFDAAARVAGVDTHGLFGKITSKAYSQRLELEADYMGLYIIANTGIEFGNSGKFWRRLGAEHPKSIKKSFIGTHPSSPERLVALENSIVEIQKKQTEGLPLTPEYKKKEFRGIQ